MIEIIDKYLPLIELIDEETAHKYEDIRYVLLTGSRGSGKSVGLSTFLNIATYKEFFKILFTRFTMTSAETSIIPEFREKCEWLDNDDQFEFKRTEVVNTYSKNQIIYRGLKPQSKTANSALKSVNGVNIFVLEEAEECTDEALFEKVDLSIRTTKAKNLVIICMNPCHKNHWIYNKFFKGGKRKDTLYIHTTYLDNLENLDKGFIANAEECKAKNFNKYRHLFLGEWTDDTVGALWKQKLIDDNRILKQNDNYKRIVVSIDPAVTSNENSDEHGITVEGETLDGEYHLLDDKTTIATPHEACRIAISLYHKYEADKIIGEVNNGGDWIEELLRTIEPNIPYEAVRASRGKITRAEPISSLYEQNKVKHVGYYPELEYEMTTYTGDKSEKSPNRLDSIVWGFSYLSQEKPVVATVKPMPYF
jgi:phage terminase large subunit